MAKNVSAIFKLQGTMDGKTFVNSQSYGPHVRAARNSITPFKWTEALATSSNRLQVCGRYLRPVFQVLRTLSYEGSLWHRMLSLLFASLKEGKPLGLESLKGLECNLQHKLSEVLPGGYDFCATVEQNVLQLRVLLHAHPVVNDTMPRAGYQVRMAVISPSADGESVGMVELLGPVTAYDSEREAVAFSVELPEGCGPVMVVLGVVPHLNHVGATKIMSDSGVRCVWVG